eukprot:COSAG05_NODE_5950_length_1053_cov_0.969602_1_plen_90_part_00
MYIYTLYGTEVTILNSVDDDASRVRNCTPLRPLYVSGDLAAGVSVTTTGMWSDPHLSSAQVHRSRCVHLVQSGQTTVTSRIGSLGYNPL